MARIAEIDAALLGLPAVPRRGIASRSLCDSSVRAISGP